MATDRQRRRRAKEQRQSAPAPPSPPSTAPAPTHVVDTVREALRHAIDDEIAEEHAALAAYVAPSPSPRARRGPRAEWLTVAEAAARLAVARSTLYRRAARGTIALERDAATGTLWMSRAELQRVRRLAPHVGGRPAVVSAELRARIARMRADGMSLGAIADELTADDVPTAHGGARWWPSTVRAVLGALR